MAAILSQILVQNLWHNPVKGESKMAAMIPQTITEQACRHECSLWSTMAPVHDFNRLQPLLKSEVRVFAV